MSNKSCCDCSCEDDTFLDDLFSAIIYCGKIALIAYTTDYLIDKTTKHSREIKELFSRLEKCEKKT